MCGKLDICNLSLLMIRRPSILSPREPVTGTIPGHLFQVSVKRRDKKLLAYCHSGQIRPFVDTLYVVVLHLRGFGSASCVLEQAVVCIYVKRDTRGYDEPPL